MIVIFATSEAPWPWLWP